MKKESNDMKYIKTVTVTPLREDGAICTLMANDKYKNCTFENGLSTGYFPAPMVVEIWQAEDSETADDSATEFVKYLRGGRHRGEAISNSARQKILQTVRELQPNQFIRLRRLTPSEVLRFQGVTHEDAKKMQSVNTDAEVYKQAGNSICVNCLTAIFENLFIHY